RIGDQHHGAAVAAESHQCRARFLGCGHAVVHDPPDVAEEHIVAWRKRCEVGGQGGRGGGHWIATGRRATACGSLEAAPVHRRSAASHQMRRAIWLKPEARRAAPASPAAAGARAGAAGGAGGASSTGSRAVSSPRSPTPCRASARTGRGGENTKPWPK